MTQFNKLLSRHHRMSAGPSLEESRCSGRTTAIKLRVIHDAILQPGKWIEVRDHYNDGTSHRNATLVNEVMELTKTLGLRFFEWDQHYHAAACVSVYRVRSNHFTDNQWEIE